METLREEFSENGVVCVRGALDRQALGFAEEAYQWTLNNPGPGAREVLAGKPGAFYQDHANPNAFPVYSALLCDTGLSDLVARVLGSESLWLLYEQIWLKKGDETLPTPWHQDLSYVPLEGDHLATVRVNLDVVPQEDSLEFVRASHRGPLFNPTAFDSKDPSAAMFPDGVWPSLPDIEEARDAWPIVSWGVEPGDVLIFHPAMLHGGAPTRAGRRRRSMSLRFFGDQAYCAERPEQGVARVDRVKSDERKRDPIEEMAHMAPGSLFRHPGFPQLR